MDVFNEANMLSNPPSSMDLEDLMTMATARPDTQAINLPATTGQPSIEASTMSVSPNEVKLNHKLPLNKRIGDLLDKQLFTDVVFKVGECESECSAHKLILALASPVFSSMFFSSMDSLCEIQIPDCHPEAFQALLQFVYKNEASSLRTELAPEILYAARKYSLKGLEDACLIHMSSNITHENVFEILQCTHLYELAALEADCWEFIEEHPKQVLTFHLPQLELDMLLLIVKSDKLKIVETDLFEIVLQWTELECLNKNLQTTLENKRMVGAKVFDLIRYTNMNPVSFVERVVSTGILSVEDVASIFVSIHSAIGNKPEIRFNEQKRTPRQEKCKTTGLEKGVFQFNADSQFNVLSSSRRKHRPRRMH